MFNFIRSEIKRTLKQYTNIIIIINVIRRTPASTNVPKVNVECTDRNINCHNCTDIFEN